MPTSYQEIAPFSKQMTIIIGLCVVGLMAFGLALSYYKNILFDRQLVLMEDRNQKLRAEIIDGYNELKYLHSTQYKDKYAKENLNLLNAGEKALILEKNEAPVSYDEAQALTEEEKQAIYEENLRGISIIDHWKLYLFAHDKIEDLRNPL